MESDKDLDFGWTETYRRQSVGFYVAPPLQYPSTGIECQVHGGSKLMTAHQGVLFRLCLYHCIGTKSDRL